MFTPMTTAPIQGQEPYKWGVPSEGQCTWGAYYRSLTLFQPPTWWDRETKTGSYTNAKDWLANYRDPWEVKGADYKPVAGDIAVFDGEYGHVVFIEQMDGNVALISDWNRVAPLTYASDKWDVTKPLARCGELLGYLHYPENSYNPVPRNEAVNQIETTDDTLRIRTEPSLSGEIVGHVQIGYYNVLSQSEADGYTWYEIEKGRYCANITTTYLPSESTDFIRQIEEWANAMVNTVKQKDKTISDMTADMKKISELSSKW